MVAQVQRRRWSLRWRMEVFFSHGRFLLLVRLVLLGEFSLLLTAFFLPAVPSALFCEFFWSVAFLLLSSVVVWWQASLFPD
ncbi:hypothetical protein EUTSA_v10000732mg [Eutrema salsugineum]|uniref:Uncharacterized protein n=1 Tax=Eutrema salsugineum TaxID=72664 RepID=V4LVU0_EUTSA|nr:hypothetical protein EUTSA_v10000732mg [Eutrema salsugineum]